MATHLFKLWRHTATTKPLPWVCGEQLLGSNFCKTSLVFVFTMGLLGLLQQSIPCYAQTENPSEKELEAVIPFEALSNSPSTTTIALPQVTDIELTEAFAFTTMTLTFSHIPDDLRTNDWAEGQMSIAFSGEFANPERAKSFSYQLPNLQQIYYEQLTRRIQIFIKRKVPHSVVVETNKNKNQIVIKIPHFQEYLDSFEDEERFLTNGIMHKRWVERTSRGPIQVNLLRVDPKIVNVVPKLAYNRMGEKERLLDMVVTEGAYAGINASFYKQDVGIPIGMILINKELVSGPLYNRSTLGITQEGKPIIAQLDLQGSITLPNGLEVPINNVNQPRVTLKQIVLYTDRWGTLAPNVPKNGFQIQIIDGKVTNVSRTNPLPIPKEGYVVSGPNITGLAMLAKEKNKVELLFYTLPDWSNMAHAVTGGPYLLKNGEIFIDANAQHFTSRSLGTHEPRTAVGIDKEGLLLFITVDGRQSNTSVGVTLWELARLLKGLGAVEAMNLDGGSSTQMVVDGKMVNSPVNPSGIPITSGLLMFADKMGSTAEDSKKSVQANVLETENTTTDSSGLKK